MLTRTETIQSILLQLTTELIEFSSQGNLITQDYLNERIHKACSDLPLDEANLIETVIRNILFQYLNVEKNKLAIANLHDAISFNNDKGPDYFEFLPHEINIKILTRIFHE